MKKIWTILFCSSLFFGTSQDIAILKYSGGGDWYSNPTALPNLIRRDYLISGGFLHIDDNYGMKPFITEELRKVFPNNELVELPKTHAIFNSVYSFPEGLPKIHEHDGLRPQALGIFYENRLVLLFTYESDLGDGWEDPEIHNDPPDVREKALKMGANIIKYAFEN
jgi:hypothetical protein